MALFALRPPTAIAQKWTGSNFLAVADVVEPWNSDPDDPILIVLPEDTDVDVADENGAVVESLPAGTLVIRNAGEPVWRRIPIDWYVYSAQNRLPAIASEIDFEALYEQVI